MLLLKLCRRGEGGVKLHRATGIIDLLGLAADFAAACRMAGILEGVKKTSAKRCACARLLQGHFASLS